MAFRTITARYDSTCRRCGEAITAGSRIRYGGRGRTYHLHADCPAAGPGPTYIDANHGLVDTVRPVRVHVTRFSSGDEVYQNVRGRCEDAPCCGCCTY